jgi:peptidoglycan-N-acetylglucosamine deacetylase
MKRLRLLFFGMSACALLLVGGCVLLPAMLETFNPNVVYRVPGAGKTLYLTLDDGPSEETSRILEVLKKHDVTATFFVITNHIRPDWINRISADGHQVGHHMPTSASIQRMPLARFQAEFLSADAALSAYPHVKLFRPPHGSVSPKQAVFVMSQGYQIVVGTIFPLDHWLENTALMTAFAKVLVTDGGIIILHDTKERAPRTAAVLDALIPYLKKKGYTFALLPEKKS